MKTLFQEVLARCAHVEPLFEERIASELRQLHCTLLCSDGTVTHNAHEVCKPAALRVADEATKMAVECQESDPERHRELLRVGQAAVDYIRNGTDPSDLYLPWSLV